MKIQSAVFEKDSIIPSKYTCDGKGVNPPLDIIDVPENAKSLALIVEDPDAPAGLWVHWLVWNMPPQDTEILADSRPTGVIGKNSGNRNEWYYICPPIGEHRYFFKVFALDIELNLNPTSATREDFYNEMEGHIIEESQIMGRYYRP
jgi:Raf kinase inhibitor-like YbhB/YbcL family protein